MVPDYNKMVENKQLIAARTYHYSKFTKPLLLGGIVLMGYLYRRNRQLNHDADVAKEYCMSQVINFKKCNPNWINPCKNELYDLHDCIHKSKGYNQTDIDLF